MDWLESIRKSIDYMETNLLTLQGAEEVAGAVYLSQFYLQKGFKVMTGYSCAEYIRNRRLYLAALDIIADKERLIDLAFKYGYETPESFSRAFSRFHGATPVQVRANPAGIRVFLPLKIQVDIKGGNEMDYRVEEKIAFQVIGYERQFGFEDAHREIPSFWNEVRAGKMAGLCAGKEPRNEEEEVIRSCGIGMYGVCIEDVGSGKFRYMIAGDYHGGKVPQGMTVFRFPELTWAKLRCTGPMPEAIQAVNTKIFSQWLPGNPEYEIAFPGNVEWYSGSGNTQAADYESEIWIPVKRK